MEKIKFEITKSSNWYEGPPFDGCHEEITYRFTEPSKIWVAYLTAEEVIDLGRNLLEDLIINMGTNIQD